MARSIYIIPFLAESVRLTEAVERIRAEEDHCVVLIQDSPETTAIADADRGLVPKVAVELVEPGRFIRLRCHQHAGYTRSVNAAVSWALENVDFADAWIVNDDVIFLRGLPRILRAPANAGLIGVLSNKAGYQSIAYSLDDIGDYLYPAADPETAAQRYDVELSRRPPRFIPVPLIHGFCFRIGRECLRAIGLLDDRCFILGYGSDYDLSLRSVSAGFTNYVYSGAFVAHVGSASAGRIRRRIGAIRADHELHKHYGEDYQRAKFVTRQRLNKHLTNYAELVRE